MFFANIRKRANFVNTVRFYNMGITERKQRQKEELRKTILNEARRLVRTEGVHALSIRKLADAIEYSVPVVYEHYSSKDAILQEFVREGYVLLTESLMEAAAAAESPEEKLKAIGCRYWDFAFSNKEYYQIMFGVGMPTCEAVRSVDELGRFSSFLQEAIKSALEAKKSDADICLKFQAFWSMLHGLVSINLVKTDPAQHDISPLVLRDMIAVFIKGL